MVLHVLNVELCYTRAKQHWDYVTGVISARQVQMHFSLTVCEFLNESLTGQCIGWAVQHPLRHHHGGHVIPT